MARDWKTIPMALAECLDCGWASDGRNAWGIGAQHARKHQHQVRVEVTRVYVYNDPKERSPRPTTPEGES